MNVEQLVTMQKDVAVRNVGKPGEKIDREKEVRSWIKKWKSIFKITNRILVKQISRWNVIDENNKRGASLVGVTSNKNSSTIFHTRKLTEEDIIHELLHVAHPDWEEEKVRRETLSLKDVA